MAAFSDIHLRKLEEKGIPARLTELTAGGYTITVLLPPAKNLKALNCRLMLEKEAFEEARAEWDLVPEAVYGTTSKVLVPL